VEALRERFGKYHVLEKIAQGGMAEVYKVKTVGIAGFEKVQALKRILPHSAREPRFIRSFIDEARIAVELTHRNIVQVFDFGKADGELFLAMELIEGKDLRAAMADASARDHRCPAAVAAYIVAEVAAGLDYAHRKADIYGTQLGIVHCDVSPSNVMLSTDGYVKILDFGIARASFASALERRRLRGKPRYMAPEQTIGEPATAASDVFALGIIAWELFTGTPLFRGGDIKQVLEAVRRVNPPPIDRLAPSVPAEIVAGVAKALSREPAARGTAADLAAACSRVALAGGAARLATWLRELDERASTQATPWDDREGTSVSVPPRASTPARPSTRTLTPMPSSRDSAVAIGPVPSAPPRGLGEGTPGFGGEGDLQRAATAGRRGEREQRFGDRDPTASVTASAFHDRASTATTPHAFTDRTATTPQAFPERAATATVPRSAFEPESTQTGVGRLADALPPESFTALATEVEPPPRLSYETIVLGPGAPPSALRFDDEATQHGIAMGDLTAGDLALEADAAPASQPVVEEPIDDDLPALVQSAPGERRRCVVVVALLGGVARETLRGLAQTLSQLAYQRSGVVVGEDEDAVVIAFGLEVAGEDDLAIAMGWAVAATTLVRETSADATVRIGARTGVIATSAEDGLARLDPVAVDEIRAIAREAGPSRPLFVGTAGRLTSNLYELRDVPRKGGTAIEVVGPRGHAERDRSRFERRGKFVGRTAQLAELEVWLKRGIAADRRLGVLVRGAAGAGKTRLVTELVARRQAAGTPLRVVATGGNPTSRHAPFALVVDLYQAALGLPPGAGRAARTQLVHRLGHMLGEAGVTKDRAREIVSDLDLAMELRDGLGVAAPEVADLRPRIAAGLAAFRLAMTDRARPLLTIIEDIHFADGPSLEVLRHVLGVPAQGPELLVLTMRPDGPPPPAVEAVINVGDLVGSELRALITDRLGDAATPLNIAAVLARGGGNPLFVEELARAVRESGEDLPATARDVVTARIDRLSPEAKATLRDAALLGGTVRLRLLEELLGVESLFDAVEELVQAGFVVRAGRGDDELQLTRGLIREVAIDALSARALRDGHARIGRLLASRFLAGREEPPAVIAEHLERGGERAAAAAFWVRAGRLSLSASDADAAVSHFTRAITIERALGVDPPSAASHARRRAAFAAREEAHRLQGDLAADVGDLEELQRLSGDDPRRLADIAIRRAQRLSRLGDYAAATVATVVAEDHAITCVDARMRGEALRVRAEILERLGRFEEALATVGVAAQLFAGVGAVTEEMQALVGRGRIHLMRAHYEAAREAYQPVLARIAESGDPWLERVVTNHVAIIELCLGNYAAAMTSAQRSLELCRRYGDRAREGEALSVAGIVLLEVGLLARAQALFSESLELLGRTGSRWSRADCLIYAGLCEARRGGSTGLAMLDEALAEARRLGARYLEANALITRAAVHLEHGEYHDAADDALEGTEVAAAATLVGFELQGLARHAVALARDRRSGRIGAAGSLVHRALGLLDAQRYVEGSPEEVLAHCVEVLRKAGADDRADRVQAGGKAEVERRLAGLVDPDWRAAYLARADVRALLTDPAAR
jgi:serine/threonine protein kinase/tetratricopeptide (TPR) repeat protein